MFKKVVVLVSLLTALFAFNANANEVVRKYGSDDAPVKIEEFSSLTCPYCAKFHKTVYPELLEKYVTSGKVQIIYYNFPLDNVAMAGAMLGLSIKPNKYFAYLEYAYNNQAELMEKPLPTMYKWGTLLGLNKQKVDDILQDNKLLSAVSNEMKNMDNKYKITGTPTLIINGDKYDGKLTTQELFSAIEDELK